MSLQTIYAFACEHPTKPAVVHNGATTSYADFADRIGATQSYLKTQNLPEGHTVVVIIHNLLDCWVAVLALQALGHITVCVKSTELIDVLAINNVAGIVTTDLELPQLAVNSDSRTGYSVITLPNTKYISDVAPRGGDSEGETKIGGHILYTSGTTGNYKKLFFPAALQQRCFAERIEWLDFC